ncbi:MAG: hypothetical protein ACREP6_11095, partial [Candidatus Binataceae bacterium]
MISVQRGRGGWRIDSSWLARAAVMMFMTIALAAAGCASKKSQQAAGAQGANGAGGVGEQGINGNNKSSLSRFQQGTLGAGQN